ncbi:hypothetical protein HZH66_009320 [Vespula vulgaris]|uniref:Uncharacterized protein n=1 Tax=Vespula vulgaris TaxID=7454 RepID=A0A834MZ84_VESVU|nr:hypothetical protein HZH66_009320 [Vespula vulgaris]
MSPNTEVNMYCVILHYPLLDKVKSGDHEIDDRRSFTGMMTGRWVCVIRGDVEGFLETGPSEARWSSVYL